MEWNGMEWNELAFGIRFALTSRRWPGSGCGHVILDTFTPKKTLDLAKRHFYAQEDFGLTKDRLKTLFGSKEAFGLVKDTFTLREPLG